MHQRIIKQDAVGDDRRRFRCRHLANLIKRNVLDFDPLAPLCENMTSSAKPEVHIVLQYFQRRTDPRPHVTMYLKHFVKVGHEVFEICEQGDRRTMKFGM